jgi:NAD(P)-dependent dehydrogenase (short-subunit alcohol dehydrogenase family)
MIAQGFVDAGARVYICSRNAEACEKAAAELAAFGECVAVPGDVATVEGCERIGASFAEREELLHVLVNNAGTSWAAPIEQFPDWAFDKSFAVNVKAAFHMTRVLLPALRRAATPEDPARVIMIGSVEGDRVPDWESYSYSTAKAAVAMLGRHLANRLARDHITVNTIAPALFMTEMTEFLFAEGGPGEKIYDLIPLRRHGTPQDMAGTAIFLASRAASFITGAVIPLDGGLGSKG